METFLLPVTVLLVGLVVIGIPMIFLMRTLSRLSERVTLLTDALEEVHAKAAAALSLSEVNVEAIRADETEHAGGV